MICPAYSGYPGYPGCTVGSADREQASDLVLAAVCITILSTECIDLLCHRWSAREVFALRLSNGADRCTSSRYPSPVGPWP
jgi:hypothetical protein